MKNIIVLLLAIILLTGCNDENLPRASFDLYENASLVIVPGDTEVELNWEKATEGDPDGYLLTWTSSSALGGEQEFGANEKSAVIKDLINGIEYTFAIQSRYGHKLSGKIAQRVTPRTSRYTVEDLVAAAGDSRVKLQWTRPASDNLSGYTIIVNPGSKDYIITSPEVTSHVITGLSNDQEYEFTVIANYSTGLSEPVVTVATPGNIVPILIDKRHYLVNQKVNYVFNEMYFMGDVKSVLWDFGDGNTSTQINPQYAYTNGGKYDVSIEVTYTDDTKESKSVSIHVIHPLWNYMLKNSNGSDGTIKTSNPAFSPDGNTVYIPSSTGLGDLHAIDTSDGSVKWIFSIPRITYGGGPSVGDDGAIYQGAQDDKVYAINPDGTMKWSYNAGGRVEAFVAVTVDNEVYALSNTNLTLHAISANGSGKWTRVLEGNPGAVAVVDNVVYAGTSSYVYSFDMDGNELWKTAANVTERGAFAFGDNTLYAAQRGGNGLIALDKNTGTEKWTYKNISGDAYGPIVDKGGTVYFTDKGGRSLYAVNSNGSEKWVFTTKYQLTYSLPVMDENGIVYFSTFNQDAECAFYAVNTADGTEVWKITLFGSSDAEKGMAGVTIGPDNKLYVSTISGGLTAIPIFAGPEPGSWSVRGGNPRGTNFK